jgi:hypothetical protein
MTQVLSIQVKMPAILSGTSVAATAVYPSALRVYFQDHQGGIREGSYPTSGPGGWSVTDTPIFSASRLWPSSVGTTATRYVTTP